MTGLEKMVAQITDEAEQSAKGTLSAAAAQAEEILAAAQQEADKLKDEISRKSDAETANYMERVKSSADLKTRTAILQAKQEVIAGVLAKAYDTIGAMEDPDYFDLIKKLLQSYVQPGVGEIYFSERDLGRMSAAFKLEMEAIAVKKGGVLKLAKESKEIESGFILVYGGVEENCTFRALFNAEKDRLQDIVYKELFS